MNIVVLPCINKVICDKFISHLVPGSEFHIVQLGFTLDTHRSYIRSIARSVHDCIEGFLIRVLMEGPLTPRGTLLICIEVHKCY